MIVLKFGGTSLGSRRSIDTAVRIVESVQKKKPLVVLSAIAGVTDLILESAEKAVRGRPRFREIAEKHKDMAKALGLEESIVHEELDELFQVLLGVSMVKELTPRTLDRALSFGERMSVKMFSAYAAKKGLNTIALPAYKIGMVTDSSFGSADILPETPKRIYKALKRIQQIPIITGFIGKTKDGHITTLGRGGSDYTAAILGAAVNAEEIQIWTDVDGVMSADPRVVKSPKVVDFISYEEASELSYFGAKVLHPKTILPAVRKKIPVKVLNTLNPQAKGTTILTAPKKKGNKIIAVVSKKGIILINIHSTRMLFAYGYLRKIFKIFDEHRVCVDMISTSEVNVSVTVADATDIRPVLADMKEIADVSVERGKTSICVVGSRIKHLPGIAASIFDTIAKGRINVEMITQGASEINIGFVVDDKDAEKAVRLLYNKFFGG